MLCIVHPIPTVPAGFLAEITRCMLDGLSDAYAPLVHTYWNLPPLYQSGIRFELEPDHGKGIEDYTSPPITYGRGTGDCDDLVLYRLSELKAAGIPARCTAEWLGNAVHVQVRLPNGAIEDPSLILGAKAK